MGSKPSSKKTAQPVSVSYKTEGGRPATGGSGGNPLGARHLQARKRTPAGSAGFGKKPTLG